MEEQAREIARVKERVVERVVFLRKRKRFLEEEMCLMEKRRNVGERKIASRVETTEGTKGWRVAAKDYVAEYYEGKEEGKVTFRFNAEKGCFEETVGKE